MQKQAQSLEVSLREMEKKCSGLEASKAEQEKQMRGLQVELEEERGEHNLRTETLADLQGETRKQLNRQFNLSFIALIMI